MARILVRDELLTLGLQCIFIMITASAFFAPDLIAARQLVFLLITPLIGVNSWCRWRDRQKYSVFRRRDSLGRKRANGTRH